MPTLLHWIADEQAFSAFAAGLPSIGLLLLLAACIFVLSRGASWMIDGAVQLADRTGLPRIVIGATIISLGTTTPEAIVSVMAAWMGNPGLALGNGVGSIICDTGMIFGITALLSAVPVNRFILNRTGWIQVGSATLLVVVALAALVYAPAEPTLERWVGLLFLVLLAGYLYLTYRWARQGAMSIPEAEGEGHAAPRGTVASLLLLFGGLGMLIVSARLLVPTAAEIARRIHVPDDVIAATLVALGTSLPELTTAIAAVRKGHPEITIGNIVGADVLNCLFVIGAAAAARPLAVPRTFYLFHFPAMLLILYSFRLFIALNREGPFRRWQGAWLLGIYLVYLGLQYGFEIGTAAG